MPWEALKELLPFATPLGMTLLVVLLVMRSNNEMRKSIDRVNERYAETGIQMAAALAALTEHIKAMSHVCPMHTEKNHED